MAKLLVVDDVPSIRQTLNDYLVRAGYTVFLAADSASALEKLKREKIDVILSDIVMPGLSGIDLLKIVREKFPSIQVVLMTGEPTVETASDAVRAGAFDYLSKPFSLHEVGKIVTNAVRVKELEEERSRLEEENKRYQQHLENLVEERTRQVLESRESLERTQEQLLTVMQTTPHGLCMLAEDWSFDYMNHSLMEIIGATGTQQSALAGKMFGDLFPTKEAFEAYQEKVFINLLHEPMTTHELQLQTLQDKTFWCQVSLGFINQQDSAEGFVATLTDTSRRKSMELELEHKAYYDQLTGLSNRTLFLQKLTAQVEKNSGSSTQRFAVMFLDIDRFKIINDSYGHSVGDALLVHFARRVKDSLRPHDVVARLGGDEFAILLANVEDSSMAYRVAERIHRQNLSPFRIEGNEFFTSASIGIVFGGQYLSPEEYLRNADIAMYRAKADGRGSTRLFNENMHVRVKSLLQTETDLRKAVENKEFVPYFQSIVSLEDGQLIGFEALIRWRHPNRGLVSPGDFIPVAEDSGLINVIGVQMLHAACTQVSSWNSARPKDLEPLMLTVNVSAKQVTDETFFDNLAKVLDSTGFPGTCLGLEITESTIVQDTKAAETFINQASALGVSIYLDDFGTGYSSLSYLHKFHVHTLKIDRSFVSNLGETDDSLKLVRTIIALSHNLGLDVVAEGIETKEQWDILKEIGCKRGQGFYFSKPISGDEISTKLLSGMRGDFQ